MPGMGKFRDRVNDPDGRGPISRPHEGESDSERYQRQTRNLAVLFAGLVGLTVVVAGLIVLAVMCSG